MLIGIAVVTLSLSPLGVRIAHATAVTCGQPLDSGDFVLEADLGPCDDPTGAAALTINGSPTTPATLEMAGFSALDLEDTDPSCGNNKWKGNTFGTASQTCIK